MSKEYVWPWLRGSANEVRSGLETADAAGYVEADPKHIDELDKIARTTSRLMRE